MAELSIAITPFLCCSGFSEGFQTAHHTLLIVHTYVNIVNNLLISSFGPNGLFPTLLIHEIKEIFH